jgi:hypothetical protein
MSGAASARHYATPRGRWVTLVRRARDRAAASGVPFDAKFMHRHFVDGLPLRCEYSGVDFDFTAGRGKGVRQMCAPSIDQLVPGAGYVEGNAFAVAWILNAGKSDYGLVELEQSHRMWRAAIPKMRELLAVRENIVRLDVERADRQTRGIEGQHDERGAA